VKISYDPAKNAANVAAGRPSFDEVARFDFETAAFAVDDRRNYGETRYRGLGLLDGRLYALVFVETETGIRVISFRKANNREVKRYEKARQR
jgi:uncharacterized protein